MARSDSGSGQAQASAAGPRRAVPRCLHYWMLGCWDAGGAGILSSNFTGRKVERKRTRAPLHRVIRILRNEDLVCIGSDDAANVPYWYYR